MKKLYRFQNILRMLLLPAALAALCSCSPEPEPATADMSNPAADFCEQQGNAVEIRTAADGSQSGFCIFPNGSECDEWAYYRGECAPAGTSASPEPIPTDLPPQATEFPTQVPFSAEDYQGWWTYTHPVYGFSIQLPEDWSVEEVTSSDPQMNGHELNLHPTYASGNESIRMTFRRSGEETLLWPTGVGQGEFIAQGNLDIAGQPAQRLLLVCPTGEITSIYYHQAEGQANIVRGGMEFGFIFTAGEHCQPGISLGGKLQRTGEMIIASLQVP